MRIPALVLALLLPVAAHARPRLSGALAFVADGRMPPEALPHLPDGRLQVWVRFGGPPAALQAAGIEPVSHAGHWYTARVRPERLAGLTLEGAYLEEAHILHTQLDRSVPETGTLVARAAQPDLDGRGVVVGVVDTGIDITHEDFRRPDGHTRVLYLQDVSAGAGGLHPELATAPEAAVWDATDIDYALAQRTAGVPASPALTERDLFGHGTHVAGIAAGSGRATGAGLPAGRYVGMAPGADLVIVKGTRGSGNGFSDTDIADGVRFVFERAAALGRPAVVNLSIGAQSTAHTGHSAMEEMLSALVGSGTSAAGRIIVAAAGNDGGDDIHASGELAGRGRARVPIEVDPYTRPVGAPPVGFSWEVWYPPTSGGLTVTVISPAGRVLGPVEFMSAADMDTPEGHVYVDHARAGTDAASGRNGAYCSVQQSSAGPPARGNWQVELRGGAHFDLWISSSSIPANVGVRGELDADDHLTIPGIAENIISVGSYTTRSSWRSFLGTAVSRELRIGDGSFFSGTGPTADGRFKPDLSAPGEFVTSSLSADARPPEPGSAFHTRLRTLWADDGVHGLLRGTSMATPHVTGAVALLLQKRPDLDAVRMRELLRASARTDAQFTGLGNAWGPRFGFGKLAVDVAARVLDGAQPGPVDAAQSAVGVSRDLLPPLATAGFSVVTVVPKDQSGLPLPPGHAVEISASAGRWLDEPRAVSEFGRYERRLVADRAGAAARVTVRVDGVELARHPTVWFVSSRADIGSPYSAAGSGCTLSPGWPGLHLLPLAGLLALLLSRRLTCPRTRNIGRPDRRT